MFESADTFNGDISTWDTSSATTFNRMFSLASAFEGKNGLAWSTSKVEDANMMFYGAISFAGNGLESWSLNALEDARFMVS